MDLVRWRYNPLREWEKVQDFFDRLFFEPVFPLRREFFQLEVDWRPAVDLVEEKDQIILKADLPGVKKEDLKISVDGDLVFIKGELQKEKEEKEKNFYCCERSYGSFGRVVRLPYRVEAEKVKASLKDGILELRLPKREEEKSKEIPIEVK